MGGVKLVRRFGWLMFDVDALAAVNTLVACVAKVIGGVKFSLAGMAFPPKLRCILPVQFQTLLAKALGNINVPLFNLSLRERKTIESSGSIQRFWFTQTVWPL